jgi:hypothetical protein
MLPLLFGDGYFGETSGQVVAHGLFIEAMIGDTRKNSAQKQPSRVSFVDCNVLHCLHFKSHGSRANASESGGWSPHNCTILSGVGQALCMQPSS